MIKRRFYKAEHGDKEGASSDSLTSSSSDSDAQPEISAESERDPILDAKENDDSSSISSGFMKDGHKTRNHTLVLKNESAGVLSSGILDNKSVLANLPKHILKCKLVYKCKICPKVVCFSEETMMFHVNSKRHARSEKLLKLNSLKAMLNDNGEIEFQETAAEMHARIVGHHQEKEKKANKGRQRQRKRALMKKEGKK